MKTQTTAMVWTALAIIATASSLAFDASGAPVAFPLNTTVVRLDGTPLGYGLTPNSQNSLRFTVAFNPADSLYHLFVLNGGDTQTPADMRVADITYATSVDGVAFVSKGKLNPPANWWTQIPGVGATDQPTVNYLRLDHAGAAWLLTIWSPNDAASGLNTGRYNYNANVWDVTGVFAGNLNIVQHGPLPSATDVPPGPGGNFVGSFGMVGGNIYLRQDTQFNSGAPVNPALWGGGMGRYVYTDGTRPTLSPIWGTSEADLFTGTQYCWMLPAGGPNQCTASPALKPSYVHNSGRTLQQGAVIGAYYTFRDWTTGARQEKQIYYVESADGGTTWAQAAGVYADGNAVLVDGLPNAGPLPSGNFSSPEVIAAGAAYREFFSAGDGCGNITVVTNEDPANLHGPQITKSFAAGVVPPGGNTTLTVTLTAPAATCAPVPATAVFNNAGFTDPLPAGVVLDVVPVVSNTCAGTLTAVAGAGSFSLANVGLLAGQTCSVTVNVLAQTIGVKPNVIPKSGGGPGTPGFFNAESAAALADANATLNVGAPATDVPTLSSTGLAALSALLLLAAALRRRPRR